MSAGHSNAPGGPHVLETPALLKFAAYEIKWWNWSLSLFLFQGECQQNEDCPADKACEDYHCINPCKPETCKKTDFCRVLQHIPTCGFNFMEVPQEVTELLVSYVFYSARRLIESPAYCNQKLLAILYLNNVQITSVNWINRLLLSLICWTKMIPLSGGHCIWLVLYNFK